MNTVQRASLRVHASQAASWLAELQSEVRADHPILAEVAECIDELEGRLRAMRALLPPHIVARRRRPSAPSALDHAHQILGEA